MPPVSTVLANQGYLLPTISLTVVYVSSSIFAVKGLVPTQGCGVFIFFLGLDCAFWGWQIIHRKFCCTLCSCEQRSWQAPAVIGPAHRWHLGFPCHLPVKQEVFCKLPEMMHFLKQKELASATSFSLVGSLLLFCMFFLLFLKVYPLVSVGGNKKYQMSASQPSKQMPQGPEKGQSHCILRRRDSPTVSFCLRQSEQLVLLDSNGFQYSTEHFSFCALASF